MTQAIYSTLSLPPLLPFADPYNVTAIFDIDDTLWPQFEPAAKSVNVNPAKLDTFAIQDCHRYTKEEKFRLFEAFRDAKLSEQVQFYPGTEKIILLHELGIKVKISSKSFTQAISDIKRYRLKTILPFLQDSDLHLVVAEADHATTGKVIDEETTFFIDDNPHNIVKSNAAYNLLPAKTWNTTQEERNRMYGKNFYIFDNLESIINTIYQSVCAWRELYPKP